MRIGRYLLAIVVGVCLFASCAQNGLSVDDLESAPEANEARSLVSRVLYTPSSSAPSPKVLYARAMQTSNQASSSNNGKLYVTFEQYSSGTPVFPIYESLNSGQTWSLVGNVTDTVNGYGMRYQPFLYELPQAIGGMAKGTLLCAGNSIPSDLSKTKIDIYKSTNLGRTWTFVSSVATGGRADPNGSYDPVWEPFLLVANNKLICFYSDETDAAHNQKIVHKTSSDGVTWGSVVNDVALGTSLRPGMPVIAKMPNGNYIMTYEVVGLSGNPCNYQISSNPESWSASSRGTTFGSGGSPYVTVMPNGKIVLGTYGTGSVYVNAYNMTGGIATISTPVPGSYSRTLLGLANGRLFIVGGGAIGGSSNVVTCGDIDIGTSMVAPNRFQCYDQSGYYWRHYDYNGTVAANVSPIEDSQFRVVPGLASSSGVSFESLNFPGYYLRHYNYALSVKQNDDSTTFAQDATFTAVTGLAGTGTVSYKSYNYPTRYIRHTSANALRIDPISTATEKANASFYKE